MMPLPCRRRLPLLLAAAGLLPVAALAQVRSRPVGEGSGPVSELSRPLRPDSGPVAGDGGPVGDLDVAPRSVGSVRGATSGQVRSGPVRDITVGSVRTRLPAGFHAARERELAAEQQIDDRLEEPEPGFAAAPVQDLAPLVDTLRRIRPLPPASADPGGELAAADDPETDDGPAVPGVEPPPDPDPTLDEPPAAPPAPEVPGVFMPATPRVGAPAEVVPIPLPGSTPAPDLD